MDNRMVSNDSQSFQVFGVVKMNVYFYQAYGPPAAYGSGTAAPMDGYSNETPYFPFGHPSRQAPSSGPGKRKKEVSSSSKNRLFLEFCSDCCLFMFFTGRYGRAQHRWNGFSASALGKSVLPLKILRPKTNNLIITLIPLGKVSWFMLDGKTQDRMFDSLVASGGAMNDHSHAFRSPPSTTFSQANRHLESKT